MVTLCRWSVLVTLSRSVYIVQIEGSQQERWMAWIEVINCVLSSRSVYIVQIEGSQQERWMAWIEVINCVFHVYVQFRQRWQGDKQ